MTGATWHVLSRHGLSIGDQLGNLEYAIDAAALADYRQLVGDDGCYPNLLADDCRALLLARCGSLDLTTLWRRLDLLRPPIPGRRVQVGGWLRDVQERNGRPLVRVAAFAVDEIGTEILRSEAAFAIGQPPASTATPSSIRPHTIGSITGASVGDCYTLGDLILPNGPPLDACRQIGDALAGVALADDGNGLTTLLVGWLEHRMGQDFGDDFRWGGRLSIAHQGPAVPGDTLTGDAVVIGCDRDANGAVTRRLVLLVSNGRAERIAVGEAVITSPSPRLL